MDTPIAPPWIHSRSQRRDARTAAGPGVRLRVLLRRARLDRRLAEFADPAGSAELSLRARQLTRPRYRRKLADSLDDVISRSERARLPLDPAIPIARREVRAARAALLALASILRGPGEVAPAGVAQALTILTDGTGPLYCETRENALWDAVRKATAATLPDTIACSRRVPADEYAMM
jgi:hypothetical protein